MGCSISSIYPRHRPILQAASIVELSTVMKKTSHHFHPFARLPYELRRQVWIEFLSQEIPRAYELELYVNLADRYSRPVDVDFAPGMPPRCKEGTSDLVNATAASRAISSTCREARDVVAFVLPDKFEMKTNIRPWPDKAQSAGFFRFNASRDVITVLCSSTSQMRFVLEWSSTGGSLESFRAIQHLALDIAFMEDVLVTEVWSKCGCGESGCGTCSVDPLPNFLRLFPCLKSFSIAQVTCLFMKDERSSEHFVGPVEPCHCEVTARGTKHDWPLLKGMADNVWYVSYLEESDCPFPTLPRLAYDRQLYESKWPYYDALGNLDIRILRRVTLQGR